MGTGGSRYGAGRPGWRRKCEQQFPLDIRRLQRTGRLSPGQYYGWHWTREEEQIGSIGIQTNSEDIVLTYTWAPHGCERREARCRIAIDRTRCNFGGSRAWFICPDCYRRCAVVYGISRRGNFACRVCRRLAYMSEAESPIDRCWRQQRKIEALLTEDGDRPTGMRKRTFLRLNEKWADIEERKDELWWPAMERFMARYR